MTWMRRQLAKDEGFTLIELMVVVLIIAILIAIAIPTFLGARERAQDRAAQSSLRNALTAVKVHYVDTEDFNFSADPSVELADIEPSLTFQAGASTDQNTVQVLEDASGASDQVACLEVLSEAGSMFVIGEIASGSNAGTYYNSDADGNSIACTDEATVAAWDTTSDAGW